MTVHRHRCSGNLKMWLTDGPTNGLTGVDAYGSKMWKYAMKIDTCDYWRPKVNKFYSVWSNCLSTGQWWWDKLKTITLVSTKQMSKSWGPQINAINVTMSPEEEVQALSTLEFQTKMVMLMRDLQSVKVWVWNYTVTYRPSMAGPVNIKHSCNLYKTL